MTFAAILIVLLAQQPNRPQSATPVTTGDAWDRMQQDKLQRTLEIQNEGEMASAKKMPPPNPHDAAMIAEMETHLKKLNAAVQSKSLKDVESLSGKIIGGVKFFIPETDPKDAAASENIEATFVKIAPSCAAVIKGLREGTVNLPQARAAVAGLRAIQLAAKSRKK